MHDITRAPTPGQHELLAFSQLQSDQDSLLQACGGSTLGLRGADILDILGESGWPDTGTCA